MDRITLHGRWILLPGFLSGACSQRAATDGIDADALPQLILEEELRIGSVDDPDVGFSRIGDIAIDHKGNIFVFEARDRQIRAYAPDGQLLRTIGRRGRGPGEFQTSALRFGIRGDTVWTFESDGVRRIALFTREGTHLTTSGTIEGVAVELGTTAMTGRVLPHRMLPDGRFSSDMSSYAYTLPVPVEQLAQLSRDPAVPVPRVRFDLDGTVLDTVGFDLWPSPEASPRLSTVVIGGKRYVLPIPPRSSPISITLDYGRVFVERPLAISADDASFTVTRIDLNRDTVYQRQFRYRPVGYAIAILDTLARSIVRGMAGRLVLVDGEMIRIPELPPNEDEVVEVLRDAISFPPFQPPVRDEYWLSNEGWLWLSRQDNGEPERVWIELRPDGSPVGEAHLPRTATIEWSDAETVWVSLPDEFDVPWLVKYRIQQRE